MLARWRNITAVLTTITIPKALRSSARATMMGPASTARSGAAKNAIGNARREVWREQRSPHSRTTQAAPESKTAANPLSRVVALQDHARRQLGGGVDRAGADRLADAVDTTRRAGATPGDDVVNDLTKFDTVTHADAVRLAYGLLWHMRIDNRDPNLKLASDARKALLTVLSKDDQLRGIDAAKMTDGRFTGAA
jgi:hypothetical protein